MRHNDSLCSRSAAESCGLLAKSPLAVPVVIDVFVHLASAWKEGSCSAAFRPEATRPSLKEVGHCHQTHCCPPTGVGAAAHTCLTPVVFIRAEASEIMHDIGTAIEHLHYMDIAHRDVKVRQCGTGFPGRV